MSLSQSLSNNLNPAYITQHPPPHIHTLYMHIHTAFITATGNHMSSVPCDASLLLTLSPQAGMSFCLHIYNKGWNYLYSSRPDYRSTTFTYFCLWVCFHFILLSWHTQSGRGDKQDNWVLYYSVLIFQLVCAQCPRSTGEEGRNCPVRYKFENSAFKLTSQSTGSELSGEAMTNPNGYLSTNLLFS